MHAHYDSSFLTNEFATDGSQIDTDEIYFLTALLQSSAASALTGGVCQFFGRDKKSGHFAQNVMPSVLTRHLACALKSFPLADCSAKEESLTHWPDSSRVRSE
jgi:hypothetical protein